MKDVCKKERKGEVHHNYQGCRLEIISYKDSHNCDIRFECGTVVKNLAYWNVVKGSVKNLNFPSVAGVGYLGLGKYSNKENKQAYNIWKHMLTRCYQSYKNKKSLAYDICKVDEEWHNFQNFCKWFEENYIEGYCLDKDIITKGNKTYSSKNCCFLPTEINNLFISQTRKNSKHPVGVEKEGKRYRAKYCKNYKSIHIGTYNTLEEACKFYKLHKESHIKEMAEKWKDKLNLNTYNALMNYKI